MKFHWANLFRRSPWIWAVFGLTVLGMALRWLGLGRESLWMDELQTLRAALLPWGELAMERLSAGHAPLYFLLMKPWIAVFGASETALRLPSLLLGTATIPLNYLLGRQAVSRTVGLFAACGIAVSAINIEYAQEARPYTLLTLLVLLSALGAVKLHSSLGRQGWGLACVGLIAGSYTHSYFLFFALVIVGWLLWSERGTAARRRIWLLACTVGIAAFPWVAVVTWQQLRPQPGNPVFFLSQQQWTLWDAAVNFLVRTRAATYWPEPSYLAVFPTALLLGVAILPVVRWVRRGVADQKTPIVLLYGLVVIPVLLPWLWSQAGTNIFGIHYLLPVTPALYAVVAVGAVSTWEMLPWRQRPIVLAIAVAAFIPLQSGSLAVAYLVHHKPPWREVDGYLRRNVGGEDAVVLIGPAAEATPVLAHYARGAYAVQPAPTADVREAARLWMIGYGPQAMARSLQSLATVLQPFATVRIDRIGIIGLERR